MQNPGTMDKMTGMLVQSNFSRPCHMFAHPSMEKIQLSYNVITFVSIR